MNTINTVAENENLFHEKHSNIIDYYTFVSGLFIVVIDIN